MVLSPANKHKTSLKQIWPEVNPEKEGGITPF